MSRPFLCKMKRQHQRQHQDPNSAWSLGRDRVRPSISPVIVLDVRMTAQDESGLSLLVFRPARFWLSTQIMWTLKCCLTTCDIPCCLSRNVESRTSATCSPLRALSLGPIRRVVASRVSLELHINRETDCGSPNDTNSCTTGAASEYIAVSKQSCMVL